MTTRNRQRSRTAAAKQAAAVPAVEPTYDPETLAVTPAVADRLERDAQEREALQGLADAMSEPEKPYYRACRKLKIGDKTYQRGQHVPEAMSWPRIDTWVYWRRVELVEV